MESLESEPVEPGLVDIAPIVALFSCSIEARRVALILCERRHRSVLVSRVVVSTGLYSHCGTDGHGLHPQVRSISRKERNNAVE